ncbi:MAG TPA: hypothetical protein VJM32_01775 [Candidatus Saccharimonadales bacterium]|nr:hypothetical protein [Candidatus Saccharimonadales bacterium]
MARLPIPGSDDGTWGDVLNDFLSVEHNTDGTLKPGGSLADKADDASVLHLAGSETVTGAKDFTGGLQSGGSAVVVTTDPRLTDQTGYYPPQAYGFFAMSDIPSNCSASSFIGASDIVFARVYVPAGNAITKVGAAMTGAGTLAAGGQNRFGVYDDTGVLLQTTPNNNSQWTTPGWKIATLSTPIAAQGTGRFVYVAAIVTGYSANPNFAFNNSGQEVVFYGGNGVTNRRHFYMQGQSALPASVNPASTGFNSSYLLLVGLASN